MQFLIENAIVGFPHLAEKSAAKSSDGSAVTAKYSCHLLLEKDNPVFEEVKKALYDHTVEKSNTPELAERYMHQIRSSATQRCWREGEEAFDRNTGAIIKGYEGRVFLTASNAGDLLMVGHDDGMHVSRSDNEQRWKQIVSTIHEGSLVHAYIDVYFLDKVGGKPVGPRHSARLIAIQPVKERYAEVGGKSDAVPAGVFKPIAPATPKPSVKAAPVMPSPKAAPAAPSAPSAPSPEPSMELEDFPF